MIKLHLTLQNRDINVKGRRLFIAAQNVSVLDMEGTFGYDAQDKKRGCYVDFSDAGDNSGFSVEESYSDIVAAIETQMEWKEQ